MTTQIQFDAATNKFFAMVNGTRIESANKQYLKTKLNKFDPAAQLATTAQPAVVEPAVSYSILERFGFVEKIVRMVANGIQPSMVITGEGGLGKTFIVLKTLEETGLTDVTLLEEEYVVSAADCFKVVKGFSTAKGLFRTLYENRQGVVVFDDCDSVLKDPVAINLLKAALDSYSKRIITWNSESRDESLPRSFEFEGRVVFISNLPSYKLDQAIRSRSMCVDLSMTIEQKIERMGQIMQDPDFLPDLPASYKQDALDMIFECRNKAKEISLRTLISVCKIRATGDGWEGLAKYMLVG